MRLTKTGISGLDGLARFSPVAGIQWVETFRSFFVAPEGKVRFSPVAGIQWVET